MGQRANVVSLSGGKDSTAMLIMMLERDDPIADIVFFDTGWEFPQMYEHLECLERYIGRKITRLRPRLPVSVVTDKTPLDWMFSEYPVVKRGTRQPHMIGRGWPAPMRRWCTGRKEESLRAHLLALTHRQDFSLPLQQCVGFAADEMHRLDGPTKKDGTYYVQRYPLMEWGITEADALAFCQGYGFDWFGLYNHFSRVSCFCCPLQSLDDLRTLRCFYPELWQRMLHMDAWLQGNDKGRRYNHAPSVAALDVRFAAEEAAGAYAHSDNAKIQKEVTCHGQ